VKIPEWNIEEQKKNDEREEIRAEELIVTHGDSMIR
jgi:hypothetical protein